MKPITPSSAAGLRRLAASAVAALILATTSAHAGTASQVDVQYVDPEHFTEFRRAGIGVARNERGWLDTLARHIAARVGPHLADGQRLTVVVTDVDRAGDYEPWHGGTTSDVRIVRDIYPPSIELTFTLLAADGTVLRAGRASLRDPGFMLRANRYFDDPLRYEKSLIDDWVGNTFPAAG